MSTVLLSSHCSDPTTYPSLYFGKQESGVLIVPAEHVHVGITDRQSEAHPSPFLGVVSSQTSGGLHLLFPQTSHYVKLASQDELGSIWQVELQPSPSK